jgi:hypothetical protein
MNNKPQNNTVKPSVYQRVKNPEGLILKYPNHSKISNSMKDAIKDILSRIR